jgi:hypothetical protein
MRILLGRVTRAISKAMLSSNPIRAISKAILSSNTIQAISKAMLSSDTTHRRIMRISSSAEGIDACLGLPA